MEKLRPHIMIFIAIPLLIACYYIVQAIEALKSGFPGWIAGNWGLILLISLLLGTPFYWRAYKAITGHMHTINDRVAYRELMQAVTAQASRGYNLEFTNNKTGDVLRLTNPFPATMAALPSRVIQEETPLQIAGPQIPEPCDFAEILKTFTPSDSGIYIATGITQPIIEPMYDLTHVGMGGPTGGGKTNGTRLLMGQLLYAGASVYMATPSIAQVKYNGYRLEDWRPIIARLKEPPAKTPEQIKDLLERFLLLFEKRKQQEDISPRRQKDVFLVLGELPGITARLKKIKYDGVEVIMLLLREARQYGVHVVTEFQDILVKTTGLDSGVRENLLTGIYYGGDFNTAKVLLGLQNGEKIDETGLGTKGASYVKVKSVQAQPARVPFFSNRALYQLLGKPPDPMPDDEIYDEAQIPEYYHRIVDGRYVDARSGIAREPDEGDFETRPNDRKTGPLTGELTPLGTRPEKGINELAGKTDVTSDTRPSYPRMDEIQSVQFLAGFRIRQNVDLNLRKLGLGSGYRQHARELIEQEGL